MLKYENGRYVPMTAEEIAEQENAIIPDTRTYEQKVEDYIAERYTIKQEIALINNYNQGKDIEEYEAYQAYRQECKERAKGE